MPANSPNKQLPVVGQIQGVQRPEGFDYQRMTVTLSYTDRKGEWYDLDMPFLDAMYLLNLLKEMQQDVGYSMPEDPGAKR